MSRPPAVVASRDIRPVAGTHATSPRIRRLPGPVPGDLDEQIMLSARSAQSPGTRRAYDTAWATFTAWCEREHLQALPADPKTIAAYLVASYASVEPDWRADGSPNPKAGQRVYAPSTLMKWVAAIADAHRRAGIADEHLPTDHPGVRTVLTGIKRRYAAAGERPRTPRAPLLTDDILTLIETARLGAHGWAAQVRERRDSALLLVEFTCALRRSELTALTGADIRLHAADGLHVHVRRAKTDQEGRGSVRAVPRTEDPARCTACAVTRWAAVVAAHDRHGRRGIIRHLTLTDPPREGQFTHHVCDDPDRTLWVAKPRPVFRSIHQNGLLSDSALSGAAVHDVVRRRARQAGYETETVRTLGAHSLRAGFVTQAMRNGATIEEVMRQTDHQSTAMVHHYRRDHTPLIGNAVNQLGL